VRPVWPDPAAGGGALDQRENNSANPALQKYGVTDGRMECAGRSDVITGWLPVLDVDDGNSLPSWLPLSLLWT
jgi:hypothetical protein